jgi:glycerate kinase
MIRHRVDGPRGPPIDAAFGLAALSSIPPAARQLLAIENPKSKIENSKVAVIEMAAASGLALLPADARDPWQASTVGTGQLIRAAAEAGATAVLLGVGGSATNDLGLGALSALGLDFLAADGQAVRPPIPAHWTGLTQIAGAAPRSLPPIRIACDVTNPLLGPQGAAAIYGPQKGLRPEDRKRLEHESARLALMLCSHCRQPDSLMDLPGAGAAGGLPFGLMAATGARLLPGFDLVSTWLDLEAKIVAADVIITGEGRFDQSSLSGKGPGAVAARGRALGKPVHVFAGSVSVAAPDGLTLHPITPSGMPLPEALRQAGDNLRAAAGKI